MSAKVPKNIRFRPDQIAALAELEDAETDFSALVRRAVDDLLARRRAARAQEMPPGYGSKSNPPPRKAPARRGRKKR